MSNLSRRSLLKATLISTPVILVLRASAAKATGSWSQAGGAAGGSEVEEPIPGTWQWRQDRDDKKRKQRQYGSFGNDE